MKQARLCCKIFELFLHVARKDEMLYVEAKRDIHVCIRDTVFFMSLYMSEKDEEKVAST